MVANNNHRDGVVQFKVMLTFLESVLKRGNDGFAFFHIPKILPLYPLKASCIPLHCRVPVTNSLLGKRGVNDLTRFRLDLPEMLFVFETFGIDFVDVFRS